MAEGETLSKKQATQEQQMKKLRAELKELIAERDRALQRLATEEARADSIKKDKAKTEKDLQ
eukprot:3549812-Ditylum_brightwellii.AAC.1